jgi:hypothetical protein
MTLFPTAMASVRYIDQAQHIRDAETKKQSELASQKGPSYFLANGFERNHRPLTVATKITPLFFPVSEVARVSAQKLSADAYRAATEMVKELIPHGLKVIRGDGAVNRPFSNKRLVHLCETMVCHLPYAATVGKGRLVVKMTNFASGVAVPTKDGIHYRDVIPMQDTTMERNSFRVLGVLLDSNDQFLGIDFRFTQKGVAWSVESIEAMTEACKRQVKR